MTIQEALIIVDKMNLAKKHELDRIIELAKNNDITLLCWCYPKRCHAETIKRYIESKLEEQNE